MSRSERSLIHNESPAAPPRDGSPWDGSALDASPRVSRLRDGSRDAHCHSTPAFAGVSLFLALLMLTSSAAHAENNLPSILNGVGIDQKLGAQVPGDLVFKDEAGDAVKLSSYFGKRPVVLAMVYYNCPMLCTMELNDLVRAMNVMPLGLGDDYDVVSVSFDPSETPAIAGAKKQEYIRQYKGPSPQTGARGWHFLTGREESIQPLADAVGFHFTYDPKFKQFVHASGVMILTPEGKVSRYFFGIDYAPKDLRLALVEASGDKIGTLTDTILLFCYHYDPSTSKYTLAVTNLLRVAAGLTILLVGSFLFISFKREKTKAAATMPEPDANAEKQEMK